MIELLETRAFIEVEATITPKYGIRSHVKAVMDRIMKRKGIVSDTYFVCAAFRLAQQHEKQEGLLGDRSRAIIKYVKILAPQIYKELTKEKP